jgi:hypothetical protein
LSTGELFIALGLNLLIGLALLGRGLYTDVGDTGVSIIFSGSGLFIGVNNYLDN